MRILVGVIAVVLLAGCSTGPVVDDSASPVLITQSSRGSAFPQALISGELSEVNGCFGIPDTVAVFPVGTTRVEGGLQSPDLGEVLLGEPIEGSGGYATLTEETVGVYEKCGLAVGDEVAIFNPFDVD